MTLGDRIKQRRERMGLTQGELSRRSGVEQSLISRMESGATMNPGIAPLRAIARVLTCTLDHLADPFDDGVMPVLTGAAP